MSNRENDCSKNKKEEKREMASINKEVFVAEGREERVHYSKSYVIKKKHLRTASLIGKIVMKIPFLYSLDLAGSCSDANTLCIKIQGLFSVFLDFLT